MAKRKMVQNNLVKNSIAAYFASIEIHNKPNIPYRYETVTLLLMNAWELALKAYIKKYVKSRSIFTADGHTISLDKALDYVTEHRNSLNSNSFTAINKNIGEVQKYRNSIAHFYSEHLEPYIFMLAARSALNYVEFMKDHFSKDIMQDDGFFIMPLGFKLPFRPEDFLSNQVAKYAASEEAKTFIRDIVTVIRGLKDQGIEDSIVLGFDIYFESVKKAKNSDILAAITSSENADASFSKVTTARFSNDPNAQVLNMSDEEFRGTWKHTHADLLSWCKENIEDFKQGHLFNELKKELKNDMRYTYTRRLDSSNSRSPSKIFYTDSALKRIKEDYQNSMRADNN